MQTENRQTTSQVRRDLQDIGREALEKMGQKQNLPHEEQPGTAPKTASKLAEQLEQKGYTILGRFSV